MAWYEVTGTIADWVMAGAAAYAAFNAKQWFSQRSHTKGFDKAEEILSTTDCLYNSTYKTIEELYPVLNYLNELNSGLKKPDLKKAQEFELSENKHREFISKIDNLVKELDLWKDGQLKLKTKILSSESLNRSEKLMHLLATLLYQSNQAFLNASTITNEALS
ncbi:hypothetical protein ACP3PD_07805 [Enterobacter ludwigii]